VPSIRGAAAVALAALCAAAPIAVAHEGNPNYRSIVRQIAPAVLGLEAHVLNYDDRIELVYDGDRVLVVEGYRDEPYLRFHPDGRVEVNSRSPAAYLNEDRFAQVEVPGRADHEAAPRWELVARTGRYDWHDHRIHWMGEGTLPPQIEDEAERTKVFDWTIPASAGGQPFRLSGTLTWLGEQSEGFPVAAAISLGAALLGGALLVLVVRRRRARGGQTPKPEAW
jgi:hypothetical protein